MVVALGINQFEAVVTHLLHYRLLLYIPFVQKVVVFHIAGGRPVEVDYPEHL